MALYTTYSPPSFPSFPVSANGVKLIVVVAAMQCADIEFSSNASEPSQEVCFNSTGVGAQPLDYAGTATCDAANTTDDAQTSSPSGSASLAVGYTWLVTMAMGVVVAGLMV